MTRLLLLLFFSVLGLQGCASLSRDECASADWYGIGYEDGLRGYAPLRIADHRKACAEHGVSPDLARYTLGREAGLEWYCQSGNGFRLGLKGQEYAGACPAPVETEFLHAWRAGNDIRESQQQLRRLDGILGANLDQRDQLLQDRHRAEAELLQRDTGWQRRAELLLELREIEETRSMVENEIAAIETAIGEERLRLQALRESGRRWETAGQQAARH